MRKAQMRSIDVSLLVVAVVDVDRASDRPSFVDVEAQLRVNRVTFSLSFLEGGV